MRSVKYSGRNYLSKAVKFTFALLGGKNCDQAIGSIKSLDTLKVHFSKAIQHIVLEELLSLLSSFNV